MVRIAICDDNELQLGILGDHLESYRQHSQEELEIVSYTSGNTLIGGVEKDGPCDIYILDVSMPGYNGIDTAEILRKMHDSGRIIFLTANPEYAVDSYKVKAFYYLVKPVDRNELFRILDSAIEEIQADVPKVTVKTVDGTTVFREDSIVYIEICDRRATYHLSDGRTIVGNVIRSSFKTEMEPLLSQSVFMMISASTIVNFKHTDMIDSEKITMSDGSLLYPSRASYTDFKKAWKAYNGN